jgi:hypothetical protein
MLYAKLCQKSSTDHRVVGMRFCKLQLRQGQNIDGASEGFGAAAGRTCMNKRVQRARWQAEVCTG